MCFASACAGAGDWMSQPLPGNFIVIRSNNDQVQLCIPDEDFTGGTPVVGPVITKISYNEEYLLLKVKEPSKVFERNYYIVIVESKEVLGPFSEEDFREALKERNVTDITWQDIDDLPKMED